MNTLIQLWEDYAKEANKLFTFLKFCISLSISCKYVFLNANLSEKFFN